VLVEQTVGSLQRPGDLKGMKAMISDGGKTLHPLLQASVLAPVEVQRSPYR
jgi:hypothetical protein